MYFPKLTQMRTPGVHNSALPFQHVHVSFISYYALWTCSHANDTNEQLHLVKQMVTCGNRDKMETIEVIAYKVG